MTSKLDWQLIAAKLNNFILKENKKRKADYPYTNTKDLFQFTKTINHLIKADLLYQTPELHIELINATFSLHGLIRHIAYQEPLKDYWITNFLHAQKWLKEWEEVYHDQLGKLLDKDWEEWNYSELFDHPKYPYRSIDSFFNLLLSKIVDYYPRESSLEPMKRCLDEFDQWKVKLYQMVEDGFPWWVYVFTENTHYLPYILKGLNAVDDLGKRIEGWADGEQQHPAIVLMKERGYQQVFAGWGGLGLATNSDVAKVEVNGNEITAKATDVLPSKTKDYHIPDKDFTILAAKHLVGRASAFLDDDLFNVRDGRHLGQFIRAYSASLNFLTKGKAVRFSDLKQIFQTVRQTLKKYPAYMKRKDRKYWFNEDWMESTNEQIGQLNAPIIMLTTLVIRQVFDLTIEPKADRFKERGEKLTARWKGLAKLCDFLRSSYVETYFNTKHVYDKEAICNLIIFYTEFLSDRYLTFTPEDKRWMYLACLEYWLDIENPARVEDQYKLITDHFSIRSTREINEEKYLILKEYATMLSRRDKVNLLKKLETFEPVNYGGAVEYVEAIRSELREHLKLHDKLTLNDQFDLQAELLNDYSRHIEVRYLINGEKVDEVYKASVNGNKETLQLNQ